jgi:hypothetical protein
MPPSPDRQPTSQMVQSTVQWGAHPYSGGLPWLCRSAKGGDISEFPPDLRVWEYPR